MHIEDYENVVECVTECEQIVSELRTGRKCVILRGAAGTGKTTLVRALVLKIRAMGYTPILVAPTGRAAKVLQNRTGCEAKTIHSTIYDCPNEPIWNEELELWRWNFTLKNKHPADAVIVVDEASMVGLKVTADDNLVFGSGSLLRDLVEWSGVHLPECCNRMVFVGDPFQLSPVGDPIGEPPALNVSIVQEVVRCEPLVVELKTIHRQKEGCGILTEANRLRDCLVRHDYGLFRFFKSSDVEFVDESSVLGGYHPGVDLDRKIILAHTNQCVWRYNLSVRTALGRTSLMPVVGDRLLSLRNTQVGGGQKPLLEFRNGELLEVTKVDEREILLEGFYRRAGAEKAQYWKFTFRKMTLRWTAEPDRAEVSCWVNISPIVSSDWRDDQKNAHAALYVAVKNKIEKRHEAELGKLNGRNRKERLNEYLKKSQLLYAPVVTFGYALTVHKAQGGEWDEVWMDCRYTGRPNNEGYFRWAYTAVTRARKSLKVIEQPSIDDLLETFKAVLTSDVTPGGFSHSDGPSSPYARTLASVLKTSGYVVQRTEKLDWRYRCLVNRVGESSICGTVDVVYNGKNLVSQVDVRIQDIDDAARHALLALRRYPIAEVMGTGVSDALSLDVVLQPHRKVAERIVRASHGWLPISSIQSINTYLLRVTIRTDTGLAHADWYFNAKGVVTHMSNGGVSDAILQTLMKRLKADAEEVVL